MQTNGGQDVDLGALRRANSLPNHFGAGRTIGRTLFAKSLISI